MVLREEVELLHLSCVIGRSLCELRENAESRQWLPDYNNTRFIADCLNLDCPKDVLKKVLFYPREVFEKPESPLFFRYSQVHVLYNVFDKGVEGISSPQQLQDTLTKICDSMNFEQRRAETPRAINFLTKLHEESLDLSNHPDLEIIMKTPPAGVYEMVRNLEKSAI